METRIYTTLMTMNGLFNHRPQVAQANVTERSEVIEPSPCHYCGEPGIYKKQVLKAVQFWPKSNARGATATNIEHESVYICDTDECFYRHQSETAADEKWLMGIMR